MKLFYLIFLLLILSNELAYSACASLIKGKMAMDVKTCGRISPEKSFDTNRDKYKFIKELPEKQKADFYNSYRGLYISGEVVRSYAIRSGLSPEKGVLSGEKIKVFFPPSSTSCKDIKRKRLKFYLDEACCEGGGDAPCLLPTSYVMKNVKIIGEAFSSAGNRKQIEESKSPEYKKANAAFRKKNYKKAAYYYEVLDENDKLDVRGLYLLGYSYRKLDRCDNAIPPLTKLDDKFVRNDYWTNDEKTIRKGVLLLARCYAKKNKADKAVPILERFLMDPKKYRSEIKFSISNKDFGWIKTTTEYQDYKKQALKALR